MSLAEVYKEMKEAEQESSSAHEKHKILVDAFHKERRIFLQGLFAKISNKFEVQAMETTRHWEVKTVWGEIKVFVKEFPKRTSLAVEYKGNNCYTSTHLRDVLTGLGQLARIMEFIEQEIKEAKISFT